MKHIKITVVAFTFFVAFGMIAPPLVMNQCLIAVPASNNVSAGHPSLQLAVSPVCQRDAAQIFINPFGR